MQVIRVSLDWQQAGKLRGEEKDGKVAISDDDYIAIRDYLKENSLADLPPLEDRSRCYLTEFVGLFSDIEFLTRFGIECHIKHIRGQMKPELGVLGVPENDSPQLINITIPCVGLFAVQKLKAIEDTCTELVQEWLELGWRIVAVCPPNDKRRPTFILGHSDQNPRTP